MAILVIEGGSPNGSDFVMGEKPVVTLRATYLGSFGVTVVGQSATVYWTEGDRALSVSLPVGVLDGVLKLGEKVIDRELASG